MHRFLGWLSIAIIIALAALGFAQKADGKELQRHSENLAQFVGWLQRSVWLLLPLLTAALVLIKAWREFLGEPWVKSAIHSILTDMGDFVFAGEDNNQAAYDRVTLFRHKKIHVCWRTWPWDGWMVPVVRSGHTSQKLHVAFRAPDTPSEAEGIAGYCWAHQRQVEVNGLPQLSDVSQENDFEAYASNTYMSVDWVRIHKPQARAYFAFPVKVKGQPWGTVVIDTRSERILANRAKSLTTIVGKALSELAQRSGR
jgi:hypothetical protein